MLVANSILFFQGFFFAKIPFSCKVPGTTIECFRFGTLSQALKGQKIPYEAFLHKKKTSNAFFSRISVNSVGKG